MAKKADINLMNREIMGCFQGVVDKHFEKKSGSDKKQNELVEARKECLAERRKLRRMDFEGEKELAEIEVKLKAVTKKAMRRRKKQKHTDGKQTTQ